LLPPSILILIPTIKLPQLLESNFNYSRNCLVC
jgi:hypothetical protein